MALPGLGGSEFIEKRVLIIDDFQGMRSMLREMFRNFGSRAVDLAGTASQALSLLSQNPYDIVLSDFNLGEGKSGQNILEEAKHRQLVSATAIWVMITGEKTMDMVMGAAEYQPDDYLIKPINEDLLRARLEKLIERKGVFAGIEQAVRAKNYQRAIQLCDARIAQKNNVHELLRMKARICMSCGEFEQARAVFEAVLAARPLPWARCGLAQLALQEKDYARAQTLFKQVIEESPSYLTAYDGLAKALQGQADDSGARDVLARAVDLSPNAILRQKALAEASMQCGDIKGAERAFRKTVNLGKTSIFKSADAYVGLAHACAAAGGAGTDEALRILGDVRKEFRNDTAVALEAALAECQVQGKAGRAEQAKASLNQAGELLKVVGAQVSQDTALVAAQLFLDAGDHARGAEILKQVVQNDYTNEALIGKAKELFRAAGVNGDQLVESARQEVVDTNNKGVRLAREGQFQQAMDLLRRAAAQLPHNKTILLNYCSIILLTMQQKGRDEALMIELEEHIHRVLTLDPGEKRCALMRQAAQQLPLPGAVGTGNGTPTA